MKPLLLVLRLAHTVPGSVWVGISNHLIDREPDPRNLRAASA